MRRIYPFLFLAALLLNSCAVRRAIPVRDWKFWAGEGVIALSVFEDGRSTCRNLKYGFVETSPLDYGTHSCGRVAGVLVGAFAFESGLNVLEYQFGHNDPSPVIRNLTPWVIPSIVCAVHCSSAAHNYSLTPVEVNHASSTAVAGRGNRPLLPVL